MSNFNFTLRFKVNSSIYAPEHASPEQWVTQITGKIFAYNQATESNFLVGKAKFFYVDLDSSKYHPFEIVDVMSETELYFDALYEYAGTFKGFKSQVCKILSYGNWSSNLFILDQIEVLPVARGQGITKGIIDEACRLFSAKADVMVVKTYPLQHEEYCLRKMPNRWKEAMKLNELEEDVTKASEKLALHYKKLGFKPIVSDPGDIIMAKLIAHQ